MYIYFFDRRESFYKNISNGEINLEEADEYQVELLIQILDFKKKTKPRNSKKKI